MLGGYIEPDEDEVVEIPKEYKQEILKYLQKSHGISATTIYNDLHGFIKYQDSYSNAYVALLEGLTYYLRKKHEEAIECYNKALEFNPQFANAYNNRGVAYAAQREYAQAIADCNEALKLNPQFADAYNNRGNIYAEKGDYDQAIKDHNNALELNPQDALAYCNRGNTYAKKGDYDQAIVDYNEALRLNLQFAGAYYHRGVVYVAGIRINTSKPLRTLARH